MKFYLAILLFVGSTMFSYSQDESPESRGYIVKVGDIAPDFQVTLIDGSAFRLSDCRGKVVMLQFTASWCGVCRKEMPDIERQIWQPFKDKALILIGIDRDEPLKVVTEFARQTGITYPLALDPQADVFGLFANKKAGVTRNVLIDKEGKIVFLTRLYNEDEFSQLVSKIAALLN